MAFIRTAFLTFATTTLCATEYAPWFSPLFEFQARGSYLYTHADSVQSPQGNFPHPTRNHSLHGSLGVTPWPFWNLEGEIFLTKTTDISFTFEAAWLTLRHAWLDDIAGDCITLVTGATLSFPGSRFLHELSLPYHGHFNSEIHATIGKEWTVGPEWRTRLWGLAGIGIAERGNPWIHAIATVCYRPWPCLTLSLFSESLFGLGGHNLQEPFNGYATVGHRQVSLGVYADYEISYTATLRLLGWYAPYTHNFIEHPWGLSLSALVPFSLF